MDEGIVLHATDAISTSAKDVMFDLVPEKTLCKISGTLEFEITRMGRFSILDLPDISVDFSSDSLDLKISGTDEFDKKVERKQWKIENSRLIVDCHELDSKNGHLFDLFLAGKFGYRLRLPVTHDRRFRHSYGPETKRRGFSKLCKTKSRFHGGKACGDRRSDSRPLRYRFGWDKSVDDFYSQKERLGTR